MFAMDHDYHCHTVLSRCCKDARMTPEVLLTYAVQAGYSAICVTNHLWDEAVPGASPWYQPQGIENAQRDLPLPTAAGVRFYFGCETEFDAKMQLALLPQHFALFDFVAIPVCHMHMKDLVRPSGIHTARDMANVLMERLEVLLTMDLPWRKVGLAHLNARHLYGEGNAAQVLEQTDVQRMTRIFAKAAALGAGIELNASAFAEAAPDDFEAHIAFFRLAKAAGCTFYCASDAHKPEKLNISGLARVAEALNLTKAERYLIPEGS